jgi:hypothetical protein
MGRAASGSDRVCCGRGARGEGGGIGKACPPAVWRACPPSVWRGAGGGVGLDASGGAAIEIVAGGGGSTFRASGLCVVGRRAVRYSTGATAGAIGTGCGRGGSGCSEAGGEIGAVREPEAGVPGVLSFCDPAAGVTTFSSVSLGEGEGAGGGAARLGADPVVAS